MNELEIKLNNRLATIRTDGSSIQEARSLLKHPLEVEAFGPQIFLSLFGTDAQVSMRLIDPNFNILDQDQYDLKFR